MYTEILLPDKCQTHVVTSPGCARVSDRSLGPELGGTPGPGSGCSLTPEPESDLSQPQPPAPQYGDAGNIYTESRNVIFSYVRIYYILCQWKS